MFGIFTDKGAPKNSIAKQYKAIGDTGATSSALTRNVVEECELKPIGKAKPLTVSGEMLSDVYLVNIG